MLIFISAFTWNLMVPSLMFVLNKSVEFIINILNTWTKIKVPWKIYILCNENLFPTVLWSCSESAKY